MGILNDMKKLLFGARSVGAHQLEEAVKATRETTSEWMDKATTPSAPAADKAADFTQHTVDKREGSVENQVSEKPPIQEPARPLDFSALDHPETSSSMHPSEKSPVEKAGEKLLDTTLEAGKKVEQVAEEIGHKVLDAGEVVAEKFKAGAEQVGAKVIEKGEEFLERAKEFGSHILHKAEEAAKKAQEEREKEGPGTLEQLLHKAQEAGAKLEEKAADKTRQFTESLKDAKDSGLHTHDSFFEKAKRFAEGDHHATSSQPKISKDPHFQPTDKKGATHGYTDADRDGNDLIDDAIIDQP